MRKIAAAVTTKMMCARSKKGMELVQVGILIAIAIALGILFKDQISQFMEDTFEGLTTDNFQW